MSIPFRAREDPGSFAFRVTAKSAKCCAYCITASANSSRVAQALPTRRALSMLYAVVCMQLLHEHASACKVEVRIPRCDVLCRLEYRFRARPVVLLACHNSSNGGFFICQVIIKLRTNTLSSGSQHRCTDAVSMIPLDWKERAKRVHAVVWVIWNAHSTIVPVTRVQMCSWLGVPNL